MRHAIERQLCFVAALAAAIVLTRQADAQLPMCLPGMQIQCACPGGGTGVQICAPDATRYQPCQCASAGAPGPSGAGLPPPATPGMPPGSQPTAGPGAAPPPGTGALQVTASPAGQVYLDGGLVGPTPQYLNGIAPGTHQVRVDFFSGGDRKQDVLVRMGAVTTVMVEPTPLRQSFEYRKWVTIGAEGGLGFFVSTDIEPGLGARLGFPVNVAIAPAVDFRTGLNATIGGMIAGHGNTKADGFALAVAVPAMFHFNLGSIYTIKIGGEIGFRTLGLTTCPHVAGGPTVCYSEQEYGMLAGPSLSLLTFRFGARREFEVSLTSGFWLAPATSLTGGPAAVDDDPGNLTFLHNDLTFTWLAL